jgi:hypothetical protein
MVLYQILEHQAHAFQTLFDGQRQVFNLVLRQACMAALPLGLAQALGPVLEQIAEMTKKIKQLRPTHQAAYGDRVPRDPAVDPGLRRWPTHGADERTGNDDSGILRDHLRATGAMEFVSAIEMGGSGSLSRMPTSLNRDMGHPILWRVQVWATRQIENRLRARRQTPPEGHLCRQGQRPRGLATLAAGRELVRGLIVVDGLPCSVGDHLDKTVLHRRIRADLARSTVQHWVIMRPLHITAVHKSTAAGASASCSTPESPPPKSQYVALSELQKEPLCVRVRSSSPSPICRLQP